MLAGLLTYRVGNENSPSDPWGRSELAVHPDGSVWLEHHFSRRGGTKSWLGQVKPATVETLGAALERAGFGEPEGKKGALVPGTTLRELTVRVERTLQVHYWSTMGDGEAWFGLARCIAFNDEGKPGPGLHRVPPPDPRSAHS